MKKLFLLSVCAFNLFVTTASAQLPSPELTVTWSVPLYCNGYEPLVNTPVLAMNNSAYNYYLAPSNYPYGAQVVYELQRNTQDGNNTYVTLSPDYRVAVALGTAGNLQNLMPEINSYNDYHMKVTIQKRNVANGPWVSVITGYSQSQFTGVYGGTFIPTNSAFNVNGLTVSPTVPTLVYNCGDIRLNHTGFRNTVDPNDSYTLTIYNSNASGVTGTIAYQLTQAGLIASTFNIKDLPGTNDPLMTADNQYFKVRLETNSTTCANSQSITEALLLVMSTPPSSALNFNYSASQDADDDYGTDNPNDNTIPGAFTCSMPLGTNTFVGAASVGLKDIVIQNYTGNVQSYSVKIEQTTVCTDLNPITIYNYTSPSGSGLPSVISWASADLGVPGTPEYGTGFFSRLTPPLVGMLGLTNSSYKTSNKIYRITLSVLFPCSTTPVSKIGYFIINQDATSGSYKSMMIDEDNPTLDFVSLYPNPTDGLLNLDFKDSSTESATIELFDINGRLQEINLNTVGTGKQQLDCSTLSSGIYLYRIVLNGQVKTGKIVKQ